MTAADVGIRIVIAMHKAYSVPSDPMYLPMHVGAILGVPVQREIITDTDSFLTGLTQALRQSSDVIVISELNGREMVSLCM